MESRGKGPVCPCVNYPAVGTQVHSQQALIRASFIQTTVFIEHGLSGGGSGHSRCCELQIPTREEEIESEASALN